MELSERKRESSPREETLQSHYCENACFVMCLGGGRGVKDSRGLWGWIIKAHKILLRLYPDPLASLVCSSSSCCECWLISFPSSREFPLDYKNHLTRKCQEVLEPHLLGKPIAKSLRIWEYESMLFASWWGNTAVLFMLQSLRRSAETTSLLRSSLHLSYPASLISLHLRAPD